MPCSSKVLRQFNNMPRFIHTADWQIGMKAVGHGEAASTVRAARLTSVERVVTLAEEHDAAFILVAGDVFEDNGVDRVLVRKIGDILGEFSGEVYLISGNHDPLVPGSVWEHPVWRELPRVHVLTKNEPVVRDDCVIFPCPLFEKYSTGNPTDWINASHVTNLPAIGLAHGTIAGLPGDDEGFPIPRNAPERTGLDYIALGHFHSLQTFSNVQGISRMAYSGTHEPTRFAESNSGKMLVVDLPERGALPQFNEVRSGSLEWHNLTFKISEEDTLEAVVRHVREIPNQQNALVRVHLSGLLKAAEREQLTTLREVLEAGFLSWSLDDSTLIPAPEDSGWVGDLPPGPVQEAAEEILRQATTATDPQQQRIATRALLYLYEIKEAAG